MPRNWVYSESGNDTTGDGTVGTPYRTPEKCFTLVQPGDSVVGRGGSYEVSMDLAGPYTNITSGNASDQVILTNYASETVTWTPVSGASALLYFKPGVTNYITVIGNALGEFILDGLKGSITSNDGIRPGGGAGTTTGFGFLFEKLLIHSFGGSGFQNAASEVTIRNCDIYNNGTAPSSGPPQYHGIYCGQYRNSIIELSRIYGNAGWGVHMYTGSGGAQGNNQIRLNKIYGNGTASFGGSGVVIAGAGNNNKVWGNWIYKNIGKGVEFWNGNGNECVCNTIDENGSWGIAINGSGSSTGDVAKNNIVTRNTTGSIQINPTATSAIVTYNLTSTALSDSGSGTTKNNNTSSIDITDEVNDAINATLASRDYTLKVGATAIDAGDSTDIGYANACIDGDARVVGSAIDIGADEYGTTDPPDAPLIGTQGSYPVTAWTLEDIALTLSDGDSNTKNLTLNGSTDGVSIEFGDTTNCTVT